jgi:1-acyl-sn-glycerol-3-phosphate acyltransferase
MITGVQARWQGCRPEDRQRIYFANHTSNLDFLIIWSLLPPGPRGWTRPVAARDYWNGGPVRRCLATRLFQAVLIERHCVTRLNNPLRPMTDALAEGSSLIIFPEGGRKRGDSDEPLPFKPGIFHLAKAFPSVELIPVHLKNLNRILPAGECLFVPLIGSATFGAPLSQVPNEPKQSFLERAETALKETACL